MVVNILVMTTITLVLGLLGVGHYFPKAAAGWRCFAWSGVSGRLHFSGALTPHGQVDDGRESDPAETSDPALQAGGHGPHLAATPACPSSPRSASTIPMRSTPSPPAQQIAGAGGRLDGLLNRMGSREVAGVLGHEVTHIANGDMVTMTLIQGSSTRS